MRNGSTISNLIAFKKFIVLISAPIVALSFYACASQPKQPPVTTYKVFDTPYEIAWDATLSVVHVQKQIPLIFANKETGVLASDWVMEERTVHDKRINSFKVYPGRYRVNISVKRVPFPKSDHHIEKVTVTVNKQFELKTTDKWRAFPSDRETETSILAAIDQEISQFNPVPK